MRLIHVSHWLQKLRLCIFLYCCKLVVLPGFAKEVRFQLLGKISVALNFKIILRLWSARSHFLDFKLSYWNYFTVNQVSMLSQYTELLCKLHHLLVLSRNLSLHIFFVQSSFHSSFKLFKLSIYSHSRFLNDWLSSMWYNFCYFWKKLLCSLFLLF